MVAFQTDGWRIRLERGRSRNRYSIHDGKSCGMFKKGEDVWLQLRMDSLSIANSLRLKIFSGRNLSF